MSSKSVVIVNSKLPEDGNTATVPERSLHVWEAQGWKLAPKTQQTEPPKS